LVNLGGFCAGFQFLGTIILSALGLECQTVAGILSLSGTVRDAIAVRVEMDSNLKILRQKDLRDVRFPSHPSDRNATPAFCSE
jgi:hypothetical protein